MKSHTAEAQPLGFSITLKCAESGIKAKNSFLQMAKD